MSDVFISYSRKNSDFVHKLDDALTKTQREVWVDWEGIARGEDWWRSIQTGIDSADTALIVVTEHWLVSEICQRELDYIRKQNKRVFPVILQKIEGDTALRVKGTWVDETWEQQARDNWKYLSSLNWLFFDDENAFDTAFQDLLTALDTDQIYVKSHTRYLVQALEWQQVHHNPSFLLEGDQLAAAKTWLASSPGKHPEPHQLHHEYITASEAASIARIAHEKTREQLIKRSRQASIGLGVAVVLAILAALVVSQQFFSARAEVTVAAATLQKVNLLVTAAINQQVTSVAQAQAAEMLVLTATHEQGKAILAQQTSAAGEQSASTRVAVAGATISPVAPTLTAVGLAIEDAFVQQDIALQLVNASFALSSGNIQSALDLVDQMVAGYPDEAMAYVGRATILDRAGKIDEAIADYTQAIKIDPNNTNAYNNRGQMYDVQGKHEEAIADYTQTIKIDPEYRDAYINRGQSYGMLGELEKGLADYNQALELNPKDAETYLMRAINYTVQDKPTEAQADYWQSVQLSQTSSNDLPTVLQGKTPFKTTVNMTEGFTENIPFEAKAGQSLQAQADAETANDETVDPLLILLDPQGNVIFANDTTDTAAEDDSETPNAAISDFRLPADGIYTLVVSHSTGGSEGDIYVTLDLVSGN